MPVAARIYQNHGLYMDYGLIWIITYREIEVRSTPLKAFLAVSTVPSHLQAFLSKRTIDPNSSQPKPQSARSWSSQSTACTTNRSLFLTSRDKVLPRRPTNFGLTQPELRTRKAMSLGIIRVFTSLSGNALASPDMHPTPPGFASHSNQSPPPSLPHPTHYCYG